MHWTKHASGESEKQIEGRKQELSNLITETLRRHPDLNYFQGYHDIAQVLLLMLGAGDAAPLLARLSLLRIRDFMLPSISATSSHLQLLPAVLYSADPALCKHLSGLQPFFALAATLTLYAHDIEEYGGIARLFDFLLAREAVISVYMYATVSTHRFHSFYTHLILQIIMTRKDELFEIEAEEPEMLYAILCKLPKPLDLEALISRTASLFSEHPPESLPFRAWSSVSSYSVLKTTRDPTVLAVQTLQEGEMYLKKHADQIRHYEARKKMIAQTRLLAHRYRRPAGAVTLAVLVGTLSLWLGRTGHVAGLQGAIVGARQQIFELFHYTMAFVRR